MSAIMSVLAWVLIGALAVILMALAFPLRLEVSLRKKDVWKYSGAVRPFGRIGPRIALTGRTKKPAKSGKPTDAKVRKRSHDPMRLLRAAVRLVLDILQRVRIDTARLDMQVGLGDPAETGQAYGMLAPLIYGSAAMPRVHIHVEPIFDRAISRGGADLNLSVVPFTLIKPLLRFGWSAYGAKR
ncbi:DUF2953 domain-containing protein [Sulfitobacter sp. JB4-11]|uniref:DUF2953 domain-containing protein n=1 Tax=Sulfitobacter rhodophyticola TaxID=3238304 RepID=UPI003510D7F3